MSLDPYGIGYCRSPQSDLQRDRERILVRHIPRLLKISRSRGVGRRKALWQRRANDGNPTVYNYATPGPLGRGLLFFAYMFLARGDGVFVPPSQTILSSCDQSGPPRRGDPPLSMTRRPRIVPSRCPRRTIPAGPPRAEPRQARPSPRRPDPREPHEDLSVSCSGSPRPEKQPLRARRQLTWPIEAPLAGYPRAFRAARSRR